MSDASKIGAFYLKFNFDVAGNTIDLLANENSEGDRTFLGLKYAQYAKADVDLRYHYKIENQRRCIDRKNLWRCWFALRKF